MSLQTQETLLNVRLTAIKAYFDAGEFKTEATYFRHLWSAMRDFYFSRIDAFEFIDDMIVNIDNQFNRAWRQGARDMNVDPRTFTDDDLLVIMERIEQEQEYILKLAQDIESARTRGLPIKPFRNRAEMWAARYREVVNFAHAYFGGRQLLEWVFGPTEHCTDCAMLNGTVAMAKDWLASGWRPQISDLECGGFKCRCELLPTKKPPTAGGIPPKG